MKLALYLSISLAVVAAFVVLAVVVASARFERQITTLVERVGTAPPTAIGPVGVLPDMVRAFALRAVGEVECDGRAVTLDQAATMRLSEEAAWLDVEARHTAATDRPAFVWEARAPMAPLVTARVVDSFVDGLGALEARLFGAVAVARAGGPETDLGEAMRYLAELPWVPEAILCNPELEWREHGSDRVEVAIDTTGGRAAVTLVFDDQCDIVAAEAAARPRDEGGRMVSRPWRGVFRDYRIVDGVRLPAHGEVAWQIEGRWFSYFRGEIVARRKKPT